MFRPILLRRNVATLTNFPPPKKKEKEKDPKPPPTENELPLTEFLGIHRECGKSLFFYHVGTHGIIICEPCNLRLVVSPDVKTYADLRAFADSGAKYP